MLVAGWIFLFLTHIPDIDSGVWPYSCTGIGDRRAVAFTFILENLTPSNSTHTCVTPSIATSLANIYRAAAAA